jgi:hypothetical protein
VTKVETDNVHAGLAQFGNHLDAVGFGACMSMLFRRDNTNRRDDARSTVIFLGTMFDVQLFMLASPGIKRPWRDRQRANVH